MQSLERAKNETINTADRMLNMDLSEDPIGMTALLFFFLDNGLESPAVDCTVAQTNAWINEKINKQKFSRFLDRELVSAVFGNYVLSTFRRLSAQVKKETLDKVLAEHFESDHFFNYTYSVMIALSVSDKEVSFYGKLMDWINKTFEKESVFNDAKKLVFSAMLFDKTHDAKRLRELVESCSRKLSEGVIPYYDRIYYAWIVWNYRQFLPKQTTSNLTQLVVSTLENFIRQWREEESDKAAKSIYGQDQLDHGPSKIALGVYVDLSSDLTKNAIVVSKDELAKTPILTRIGSLVSVGAIFFDIWLVYVALSYGFIAKITIPSQTVELGDVVLVAFKDVVTMLAVVLIGTASLSLFWDSAVKGYANNSLNVSNIKTRVKQWIKEIIISDIVISLLIGILIGI